MTPARAAIDDPSRIVRVQGQDGKTSAPVEIAYTGCKVVGNGSFGVVFMAKLVRPSPSASPAGGVRAVKTEAVGGGEEGAGKDEGEQADGSVKLEAGSTAKDAVDVVEDIAIKKVLQDKRFKVRSTSRA